MMIRKCIDSENFESTGFSYEPLALYLEVGLIYLLFSTVLTKLQHSGELTPERAEKHNFSTPYAYNRTAVIVRSDYESTGRWPSWTRTERSLPCRKNIMERISPKTTNLLNSAHPGKPGCAYCSLPCHLTRRMHHIAQLGLEHAF